MGAKHSADMAAFTGVKENTLLTWLYQKKIIQGWLPLVEAMDAAAAIAALPVAVQDLFSHVDPDSTVCVKQFKTKIGCALNQGKILFKGGKVSMKLFFCPLNYFNLTLLFFILFLSCLLLLIGRYQWPLAMKQFSLATRHFVDREEVHLISTRNWNASLLKQ
jgi:hypothetical protein